MIPGFLNVSVVLRLYAPSRPGVLANMDFLLGDNLENAGALDAPELNDIMTADFAYLNMSTLSGPPEHSTEILVMVFIPWAFQLHGGHSRPRAAVFIIPLANAVMSPYGSCRC